MIQIPNLATSNVKIKFSLFISDKKFNTFKLTRFRAVKIDEHLEDFIKYFISSSMSLTEIKNPLFIKILNKNMKCPTYDYLRNRILKGIILIIAFIYVSDIYFIK